MPTTTSTLFIALSFCIPLQAAVDADDAKFTRTSQGVTLKLLAVSDGAGKTWNPTGGPIAEPYRSWAPQPDGDTEYFDFEQNKPVPGKRPGFLFEISTKEPSEIDAVDINYVPALRSMNVSYSSGDFDGGYPTLPKGHRLAEVQIVVPAQLSELSLESVISAGPWDRVADATPRRNNSSVTSFSDGGRPGVALMMSVGYRHDRGLTAVASLALRDTETIEEQYRLAALNNNGEVLVSTKRFSRSDYLAQLVLACPPDMATPKQFQLQQRPKIPVAFRNISLTSPN